MTTRIVIKSDKVVTRTITSKGREIVFREQRAALERGEDFPHPFNINLDRDQPPYPPGDYTLDLACLHVGEYEKLEIGRLKLVSVARPAAVPSARSA